MGVEIIRKAVCDRCGKDCSCVREKIIHENNTEEFEEKIIRFSDNFFHYTEMALRGFDSRFGDSTETTIILCGECVSSLSDWLKKQQIDLIHTED